MSRYGPKPKPLYARFWPKVQKGDGCWLWVGSFAGKYGVISCGPRSAGDMGAHVASYQLNVGPVPKGMMVLHKCDVPACVRPDHLKLGTHAENMRDMTERKRASDRRGTKHHLTHLTENDVRSIRFKSAQGLSQRALASAFGISQSQVSRIVRCADWKEVG